MYEKLKDFWPNGNCNRTDPHMLHESKTTGDVMLTMYRPQYDPEWRGDPGQLEDPLNTDGIRYPLIKFNNHILLESQIISFTLHNDRLLPYIDLVFEDVFQTIEFGDMPGINNVITVLLLENIPNAHKPIKINFYITSCEVISGVFYIQGEYKNLKLEEQHFKQEVFYWPSQGCAECKLGPRFEPTTFEYLHVIADKCELGFSATEQTKEVEDMNYRLLKHQKYKDAIKETIENSGKSADNMMDAWIDPWHNIVLANVSWIMNEEVTPDELATIVTIGENTSIGMSEGATKNVGYVHRILSNSSEVSTVNNLMIYNMTKLVDYSSAFFKGTLTDYYTAYPESLKGTLTINEQQLQEDEDSLSGKETKEYEFQASEFAGFEMSELTPTIEQKQRRKTYFRKLRSRIYKASLQQPNFGIERGMLVIVLWTTNDMRQKSIIVNRTPNLSGDTSEVKKDTPEEENTIDQLRPVIDTSLSGIYYVDGTDWEWTAENEVIVQHLYLIKKGDVTEFYDKMSPTKIAENKE